MATNVNISQQMQYESLAKKNKRKYTEEVTFKLINPF
jgi:hypothetical protein